MRKAAVLFATLLVLTAAAPADQLSDLELYKSTSLWGLHGHPVGFEGRKLDRAEAVLEQRRASARKQLIVEYGEQAVTSIDENLRIEADEVLWVRGPTADEEWQNIAHARRMMARLEKRLRGIGGK